MDIDNTISNVAINQVTLVNDSNGNPIPDYFGAANWAYTPPIRKFIDKLPGLEETNKNDLGQYIPIAIPDTTTYPESDYYEIAVVEFKEKMHSDLLETMLRGYVQLSTDLVPGKKISLNYNGVQIIKGDGNEAFAVDDPHYMGPLIISNKNRPVRIKFYNLLPTGDDGNLFIPVDTTVMGAGMGHLEHAAEPMNYTQNRANIHLHGNNSVWISDGTPHQWITPANENTPYPQGVSVRNVPDMDVEDNSNNGMQTLYYTNDQSARLMFYHDHSYGITRLNVYVGEAAPYILTDEVEQDLINGTNNTEVNPNGDKVLPDLGIPLVIQDKTFVDSATISTTDPTWMWGTNTNEANTGDLWYPHVYSPAQNPWAIDGVNPFGRWMYGPWFWPPTTNVKNQPIPNPYYIDSVSTPEQPPMIPAMPFPSMPGEAFLDTPIVNGTAYPFIAVEPKAYRFRILNASDDRFLNLQLYVADTTTETGYISPDTGYPTEVKTISVCNTPGIPADWHPGIPDPAFKGPDWIQIGTESGFLPEPVIVPNQHITWNLNATTFNAGNVNQHSLLLGTAERADVIVDFSQYAGKTLILYNDAPAAFPAADLRYDYYSLNQDLQAEGGAPQTQKGLGPNTRTIMQIRVNNSTPDAVYDFELLKTVFKKSKVDNKKGVFEASQDTIIILQTAYKSAYDIDDANLPTDIQSQYVQLHEFSKTFQPINKEGMLLDPVTLQIEPKALQDEMGEVYDLGYGRMSGMLGLEFPVTSSNFNQFVVYGFASPPVEVIKGTKDLETTVIGSLSDGTQIWKITHNGVDTHTIHTHLYSAQLINRVAWDGAMIPPDTNELGWKETFRVNPLEHTVIALRPNIPDLTKIPFAVPNSIRLIDPTMPENAVLEGPPPNGWFDPLGNPIAEVRNHKVNYGWEYVYHCHILAHEEMDMMHSVAFAVPPAPPNNLKGNLTGNGNNRRVILNWTYNNIYGAVQIVQRKINLNGQWVEISSVPEGTTTYTDLIGNNANNDYYYRVLGRVTVGDETLPNFPTIITDSDFSNEILIARNQVPIPDAPTNLTVRRNFFGGVRLDWRDNASNETGFIIERSDNGGTFIVIATVGARIFTGTTSYTDRTAIVNNVYSYRVAAINNSGTSNFTNTATINY